MAAAVTSSSASGNGKHREAGTAAISAMLPYGASGNTK
jgi:hypothetical protein